MTFGVIQSFRKAFPSFYMPTPPVPSLQVVSTKVWQILGVGTSHVPPLPGADCNGEVGIAEEDSQIAWSGQRCSPSEVDMTCCIFTEESWEDFTINRHGLNPLLTLLNQAASCTTQALWGLIRTAHFTLQVLLDIFTVSNPFSFIRLKELCMELIAPYSPQTDVLKNQAK